MSRIAMTCGISNGSRYVVMERSCGWGCGSCSCARTSSRISPYRYRRLPPGCGGSCMRSLHGSLRWTHVRRSAWLAKRDEESSGAEPSTRAVGDYFDRWADRFDLFHPERPFGQDPRLRRNVPRPAGVNKLVFSRPVGQNPVWFGHFTDLDPVPVPTHEAAWHLIAQLYYGAAGRCASRTVEDTSAANSNAGPLRGALSYHPIGRHSSSR